MKEEELKKLKEELEEFQYFLKTDIPLPPLFSIEIGLLLVSIKIIWMIHKQMKVERFQFWILNLIEYRIALFR